MDDLGLNCTVCEEYFSNGRPPKNLGCGHSVCEVCASKILSADKKCPECRQHIKATSTSHMPINQPLLKLALSLIHGQATKIPSHVVSPKPLPSAPPLDCHAQVPASSRTVVDAGECMEHGNRLYFRCMTCKLWLCETCLPSNHKAPPQGQCKTLPLIQALQEMKMSYAQTSTSKIQYAEKLKRRLKKGITTLDGLREQKRRAVNSLQGVLRESEIILVAVEGERHEMLERASAIQDLMDILKHRKESVKRASDDIQEPIDAAEEALAALEKRLLQEQHHRAFRVPSVTSLSKQNLRGILELTQNRAFVSHLDESQLQRWGRVTERDGLLHLHALETLEEPPHGLILPYEVVRNMVPQTSPSLFMDIAIGSHIRGRVYVRMFGNTVRSQQALYLCSGERGPSYKETCFYKSENLDKPLEILRGGDYTNNNGSGGRAILNGITSGGAHKVDVTPGLMVGWPVNDYWRLGCFDFYLSECKGRYDNSGYGIVTQGIGVLRSAARHKPVFDSSVKDCGLVIPL